MPPKNKVYAARFPDGKTRLFRDWPSCQAAVKGVSNVAFKGFPEERAARAWLENDPARHAAPESGALRIYVDGSYAPSCKKAGWAWAAVAQGELVAEDKGVTLADAVSRNIDGELEAAARAMEWAETLGRKATIVHDYTGIACWAQGLWQAKGVQAKAYLERIRDIWTGFAFEKVEGHSGDKWNDHVDALAKEALRAAPRSGKSGTAGSSRKKFSEGD